jgi:tetratricopeptide (TPR) repeat protein
MHNFQAAGENNGAEAGTSKLHNPFVQPAVAVDPLVNIESEIAQFHIGSPSKNKSSPRDVRRNRTNMRRTATPAATPGVQDMSVSFLNPSPSPGLSASKPSVVRAPVPPSFPQAPSFPQKQGNPEQQQQDPQLQQAQPRRKVKAKRLKKPPQTNPPPFTSPVGSFPVNAIFGSDSEASKRHTAPPGMEAAAEATRLDFSPKTPFPAASTPNSDEAPFSVPQTCVNKKVRDTETPIFEDGLKFNLGNLKPEGKEGKKGNGRGRNFRRTANSHHNVGIQHANTEDTASLTENSPSTASSGDMSYENFFSPPPVPAPNAAVPAPQGNVQFPLQQPAQAATTDTAAAATTDTDTAAIASATTAAQDLKFNMGVDEARGHFRAGLKKTARQKRNHKRQVVPAAQLAPSQPAPSELEEAKKAAAFEQVVAFRDSGKSFYKSGEYRNCIEACTNGIEIFHSKLIGEPTNLLGILYSNRAAALLMVGAYYAAASDCTDAVQYTINSTDPSQPSEIQASLITKLYNRRARANAKLGELKAANDDFKKAGETARMYRAHFESNGRLELRESLTREEIEACNGETDIIRCRRAMDKLGSLNFTYLSKNKALDALEDVNSVLSFCGGNSKYVCVKIKLLSHLQRWREVVRFCERVATDKVKMDGCFPGDLALKNPLPCVPEAIYLKSNAFDGISDNDIAGVSFKLNSKTKGDVVVRIPTEVTRHYVLAMRLQEDYSSSTECIERLYKLVEKRPTLRHDLDWLAQEGELISATQTRRKHADDLFAAGKFQDAANEYNRVAALDRDSRGLLNAVMHCNRAACFMALSKYEEALNECKKALDIHPRYMKALLRRARCHMRLDRYPEASLDFQTFFSYVQQASDGDTSFIHASPYVFEGPNQVKPTTLQEAREEQQELLNRIEIERQEDARRAAENRRRNNFANQQRNSERFGSSHGNRRQHFYTSSGRPFHSFTNRGPKNSPNSSGTNGNSRTNSRRNYSSNPGGNRSQTPKSSSDHYAVLQIPRDADESDIKKAYRKLALKYHPDKCRDDPNAGDKFWRLKEAYETLNDPETRWRYDRDHLFRF